MGEVCNPDFWLLGLLNGGSRIRGDEATADCLYSLLLFLNTVLLVETLIVLRHALFICICTNLKSHAHNNVRAYAVSGNARLSQWSIPALR